MNFHETELREPESPDGAATATLVKKPKYPK
jgi:hypothetical protein